MEDTYIFRDGQQYTILPIGVITEQIIQAGSITNAFTQLIDLGTSTVYSHAFFINLLDQDIQLEFVASGRVLTVPFRVEGLALDNFLLQGVVRIKARSALPTLGEFLFQVW